MFALPLAKSIRNSLYSKAKNPAQTQLAVLKKLLKKAKETHFGKDHNFSKISDHYSFKQNVPVTDYEGLKTYIELVKQNKADVLWPGKPDYLCKTSGTTSGAKFIPLTKVSLKSQIAAARNALLCYIADTKKSEFINGKMIFLQGSPLVEQLESGVKYGRLSGIVANYVPNYLQKNRMPSYEINCIEDWETKVKAISEETLSENMTLISGIPSWVQMYFEELISISNKNTIKEIFPNFSLFVYGGVNFEPYRNRFKELIGQDIPAVELYPASEGFIAFSDSQSEEGMLLNINAGMFFEFIPVDEIDKVNPIRLHVGEVELHKNYALIINSNAGLWGYSIGDTVMFTSLKPPRIKVSGRIKHFTSAFGEHVIGKEVETAMTEACKALNISIREFHVAPQVNPESGLPFHEWFVEFNHPPKNPEEFISLLEKSMTSQNSYYKDLIEGKVLKTLELNIIETAGFESFMKANGKLGGQNKVPRLANDRKIADQLAQYSLTNT